MRSDEEYERRGGRAGAHAATRRELMRTACATAAVAYSGNAFSAQRENDRIEHGDPLFEFDYCDVNLTAGPARAQLEYTHEVLMGMDEDSLLRPFRLAAGLPAPGTDLGGWYSSRVGDYIFGPGTFGQWLSALSRNFAISRDENTRAKVSRLVEGFARTVDRRGAMFQINTFSGRYCCYDYDKYVIGLTDAQHYCGNPLAQHVLEDVTRAAARFLPGRAIDVSAPEGGAFESYTIPENQFIAWERGAGQSYRIAAEAYLHEDFFRALARGENVLPGRHAYSHANALCSAAKAYLVLGDEHYLQAATNGFRFMEEQSYATGGWGPREVFVPLTLTPAIIEILGGDIDPSAFDNVGQAILHLDNHFETPCGSYAHFKLTRYLLRITKDAHYGDSMERIMYNAALGVLPLDKFGKAFYQSNYHRYARKEYFDGYNIHEDEWPCCSGTLPQLAADYHVSTYLRDERGIYVNLYLPSALRWRHAETDITLTQAGAYPLSELISFTLQLSRPATFALRFRIPAWAIGATLRVNGEAVAEALTPGRFAELSREWRDGDTLELRLPMTLDVKPADDQHPDLVALTFGPIVLFAIGYDLPKLDRAALLAARQVTPAEPEWRSGNVRFLPWWIIRREIYTTYHDVS